MALACGCRNGSELTEVQRLKSGALEIVLLSPTAALHHGNDTFIIEFRSSAGGNPIDVGNVRASANMPMPGMPMLGSIDVQRTDTGGRYAATGALDMAGTWRLTIQWDGGPAGPGTITVPASVQ